MAVDETTLCDRLSLAGLMVRSIVEGGGILPASAALLAANCEPGEVAEILTLDRDGPGYVDKANYGWYQVACRHGLIDGNGEFLVAVNATDPLGCVDTRWAMVRLLPEWDVVGAGCASGVLGTDRGSPDFAMMPLDGRVVVRGVTTASGLGFLVVPEPHRVGVIRGFVEGLCVYSGPAEGADAAEEWLDLAPPEVLRP